MNSTRKLLPLLSACLWSLSLFAQDAPPRSDGPVIEGYGGVFRIPDATLTADPDQLYEVVFELATGPEDPADLNKAVNAVARFLNMHAQAGVPAENMKVVAVMHAGAAKAVLTDDAYRQRFQTDNPNLPLLRQLDEAGVELYLCGQSAAARGFDQDEIAPEIRMALSAMTVLIHKQREGYQMVAF